MKTFFKILFSLAALAAALLGILLLCDDKSDKNRYVTIYDDADEEE